jgi:hypothetical protein
MRKTRVPLLGLLAGAMLAVAGGWAPAQPPAQPPRSLDEKLLKDLGADPRDELDRALFDPGNQQVGPGKAPEKEVEDLGTRLRRELGAAAVAEEDSPLLEVARRMREVEGRIAQSDSGLTTQRLQQQIVADLDELIRQARKRCQQGKPSGAPSQQSSSGGQPKQGTGGTKPSEKPVSASTQRTDNGERRKLDRQQMQALVQELWKVALPPQQREQLQQWSFDEFLPQYELLIEEYYRHLSQEKDED